MVNDSSLPKPSAPAQSQSNQQQNTTQSIDAPNADPPSNLQHNSNQDPNSSAAPPSPPPPSSPTTNADAKKTQSKASENSQSDDDGLPPPPTLKQGSVKASQQKSAAPAAPAPPPRPSMTAPSPATQSQPNATAGSKPATDSSTAPTPATPPTPPTSPQNKPPQAASAQTSGAPSMPPPPSAATSANADSRLGSQGTPSATPPPPTGGASQGQGLPGQSTATSQAPSGSNQSNSSHSSSGGAPQQAVADSSNPLSGLIDSAKSMPLMKIVPAALGALVFIGVLGFAAMQFLNRGGQSADTSTPTAHSNSGGSQGATGSNTGSGGDTGSGTGAGSGEQTILSYWGLWEPSEAFQTVLDDFSEENPGIIVEYEQVNYREYRERLQSSIASGTGPDVFRFHSTWTPMLAAELATMPQSVMSASEYQETFYPTAARQLQVDGQIVGIPLMYDGLALYYNTEMLDTAQLQPPATWSEMRTTARQLTVRGSDNSIERGGVALGNAANVDHFSDVLGLLLLQNGADPTNPTTQAAQDAMRFYTNFVAEDQVWSSALPDSTVAFARGEVAMMFGPSWRAHQILAINPELEFAIAPVPKLSEAEIGWSTYWAEGVNDRSDNSREAWLLLDYLSSREVQQQLYANQSELRAFGEPYSRTDLRDELSDAEYVGAYMEDAPNARGWYLAGETHDNGVNDQLIQYYRDGVNEVLSGTDVESVMQTVNRGTQQVLRQYGIESSGTTTTN